jgi:hypothetical protein
LAIQSLRILLDVFSSRVTMILDYHQSEISSISFYVYLWSFTLSFLRFLKLCNSPVTCQTFGFTLKQL